MLLHVTSTVKGCPDGVALCIRSVREQTHTAWRHHVFAIDEETRKAAQWAAGRDERIVVHAPEGERVDTFDCLLPLWRSLPPEEPIVWLDGDDWLAVPHSLAVVDLAHERGAWTTWGQYVTTTGAVGQCGPTSGDVRREPFRQSHLKSFRAGLVQRIREEDLRGADGLYLHYCRDLAVMWPVVEMTPPSRALFIPHILCVYNIEHAWRYWENPADKKKVDDVEAALRLLGPYAPLDTLT